MRPLALLAAAALLPLAAAADDFPQPFNTEKDTSLPMPAEEAAAKMQLPPGFHATVFAAEPNVQQPIAMCTDARGRLWVAENYTYAERPTGYEMKLRDRILVFEDTDGDGRFDKRTVFWDGAERLISIEVGRGGVFALCLPNLFFIPDRNGDDVSDGKPEVVLDGFDYLKGAHTMANGLKWGPDGWLYGRQGILTNSLVGRPGTPENERTKINVGIWRYQPDRKIFESVAVGTTNPWGMDWDQYGEGFFINTVIGHLWHIIPGAHYRRMTGDDLDPRVYEIIEQHADHFHWAAKEDWTDVRKGVTDATLAAGGGHAHTGLLIYQGGQWPAEWNGKLLTDNFHGRRFNVERLERQGTGYVGRREPEAFLSADPWFRAIDLIAAPDGGIFVSDWSDTGECHDNNGVHRTSGRIYKITYGDGKKPLWPDALDRRSNAELAKLQTSPNDWLARMSRRVLADRAAAGQDVTEAAQALLPLIAGGTQGFYAGDDVVRLRALWSRHVIGRDDPDQLEALLTDGNEHLRAWALRLLQEYSTTNTYAEGKFSQLVRHRLPEMAASDPSGLVRLTLASLLQKLPIDERAGLAGGLLQREEDDADHNQPLMIWYGILPLAEEKRGEDFAQLIASARLPRVVRFGARRLAERSEEAPEGVSKLLSFVTATHISPNWPAVLDGLADGFSGRRRVAKPAAWDMAQPLILTQSGNDESVRERLRILSALFGDGLALGDLRVTALDATRGTVQRRSALKALIEARPAELRETCEKLLEDRDLAPLAVSGLGLFDDAAIVDRLISAWPRFTGQDRNALMTVLISRPAWVPKVLDAVASGVIERDRFGAFQIRQVRGYKDAALNRRLDQDFGSAAKPAGATNPALVAKWKEKLAPAVLANADRTHGREIFRATCAACHTLNAEGGNIGPDLTGAARDNLDYLLENILFPSAVVAEEFKQVVLKLKDGRILAGAIKARSAKSLKVQTLAETLNLSTEEIASQETLPISMMPEGLLDALPANDARDLIAYLMTKSGPAGGH